MTAFAFVFPGQGSQSVGMLDGWGDHPAVQQTLAEACDALGEDLASLIHAGPEEALELTTNTQPVMLVAGVAAAHRRLRPRVHALRYRLFMLLIDLDEWDDLVGRLRWLGSGRFGLMSLRQSDHGDGSAMPLKVQIEQRMRAAGLARS